MDINEHMQQRFRELTQRRNEIVAASQPLRDQRDALARNVAQIKDEMAAIATEIKRIEADLFDIDNERGRMARALGGKTDYKD